MKNLERRFSVPQENGAVVIQNPDVWVPATPAKPIGQNNQTGEENWQELVGIYTGFLRDGTCSGPSLNHEEPTIRDVAPVATPDHRLPQNFRPTGGGNNPQDVAFPEACSRLLPKSSNSTVLHGMNHREHNNIQDVAPVDKFRSFDQNVRSASSYMQNIGNVVPPRKVHSLAELMGMRSTLDVPTTNGDRMTFVMDKPTSSSLHSQVERNSNSYKPNNTTALKNQLLQAYQDAGGYNLQQVPNSRLSVAYRPSYNLNSPPGSEVEESSSVARPLQLGPVTPDQRRLLKNNQIIQVPHFSIDELSSKEKNKRDNVVLPQQAEIGEREPTNLVYDTLGILSAAISTTPKENQNSEGRNGGIDLNKTPAQRTPKRRKHRPKVVVEGKPKRTPRPTPKEDNPSGNSTTKRKYEPKKHIKTSKKQSTNAEDEVEVSNFEFPAKSCKRALNFDLESPKGKKIKGREFDHQVYGEGREISLNLNLDHHDTELNKQSASQVQDVHQNIYRKPTQREVPYNFILSVDKVPPQESLPPAAAVPPKASNDRTLNVIARSLSVRNANINQCLPGKYGPVGHHISGDLAQLAILANTSEQNLDGKRQPKLQTRTQLLEDFVDASEKQDAKIEHSHTKVTQHLMSSQIWCHGVTETAHYNRESRKLWQNGSESNKIKNVEGKINGRSFTVPSGNTTAEDGSEEIESTGNKSSHAQSYKLFLNGGLPYLGTKEKSTSMNPTNETQRVTHHCSMYSTDSGHRFQKQIAQITSHHFAQAQTTSSLTAVANYRPVSALQGDPKVTKGNGIVDAPTHVLVKRQAPRQTPSNKMSSMDKLLQKETKNLHGYGHDSKKVAGSQEYKRHILLIDFITNRMKDLNIDDNAKELVEGEQNAIVPYRGDGAMVPFEVFDPIRKRRPRPKVELDAETNRLWNLLMGKEGSESSATMDNDKQKWWEEERKVFRGRVDSFISRMHLIQGDRRFSKWKGSVVDSVIGVFLTQNVSDHLSSSAFMSLAAKFPKKSTTITETCCQNRGNPSEVLVRCPDAATSCQYRMAKEPVYDHSSLKSSQLSKFGAENATSRKIFPINNYTRKTEEGVISPQRYSGFMSFQASEDIRSSSGSNSEAEDQVTGSSFRKEHGPLNLFEQAERNDPSQQYQFQETESSFPDNRPSNDCQQSETVAYRQNSGFASGRSAYSYPFPTRHYQRPVPPFTNSWQKMLMGMEQREIDALAFLGTECISSLTSTNFDTTNDTGIEHAHVEAGQSAESSLTDQQTGSSKFQPSEMNHEVLKKHLGQKMNSATESLSRNGQFINYRHGGMQDTFQQESIFLTDPAKSIEAFGQKPSDNQDPSENITLEPTEMKTMHASDVQSSKISRTSNARNSKAEKEKVEPFNWDILRKQVQSKDGSTGRTSDTLDSLDYEALRNADVHEIANTIKERGMNNMLAERIKDFLNRLVRDHGSIDLEWLRDVQPDKAKDYLLSIRGIGLKSVECVRLLTLRNLAFPVDTNVGRIAVRLGWVPLQPLPESLQLHLLELYPVLESIQKYLWPRLCMLDQKTLYELHYQLITFGKVFCTKRQPNCNACPVKGECRHFASAFASARLALPGPEESRIVCSNVPTSTSKICGVVTKHMPLPPAEDNLGSGPRLVRNCEPIIEEPTTPESSIEVSERDIEDAFYEDPDEIPVIKLNIEEFTTNLQSFIQEKMEMQEGDMSKALVALSPQLASIPTPKLKHISRLRTEHQVYELPDSHCLLKGLDRREPDDPCPYLLAIWTPGETADSVQPPESACSSSKGGTCNKETCFSCNSTREAQAQTVRGTFLIPCRTAMRGSFPLNGTYFQVNEVFADHETSMNPIDVPRRLIWNLPRRTVFFGTSVSTIFKGMSTEAIQHCFWKGFVCVRGFDQKTRAPRPLKARLHLPANKIARKNE